MVPFDTLELLRALRYFAWSSTNQCGLVLNTPVSIFNRCGWKSELEFPRGFRLRFIRQPKASWGVYRVHSNASWHFRFHLIHNITAFSRYCRLNFKYNLVIVLPRRHDHRWWVNSALNLTLNFFKRVLHHCFLIKLILLLLVNFMSKSIYLLLQLQNLHSYSSTITWRYAIYQVVSVTNMILIR